MTFTYLGPHANELLKYCQALISSPEKSLARYSLQKQRFAECGIDGKHDLKSLQCGPEGALGGIHLAGRPQPFAVLKAPKPQLVVD